MIHNRRTAIHNGALPIADAIVTINATNAKSKNTVNSIASPPVIYNVLITFKAVSFFGTFAMFEYSIASASRFIALGSRGGEYLCLRGRG